MSINDAFHVRRMTRDDLDTAWTWCIQENWNPGRSDQDCFYNADPSGFFLGIVGDKPVSSISAVAYDNRIGFLGIYIVDQRYRGRGYGIGVWRAAIEYLGARNIGLDGVIEQQANYSRSGFKLAHRNLRYVGAVSTPKDRFPAQSLASVPEAQLFAYDRKHFFADRPAFVSCWIRQRGTIALGIVDRGRLVGYGAIRPRQSGFHIGPLFADSAEIAETLFLALAQEHPGETIFIDVPEPNTASAAMLLRFGMTPIFETARMYTQDAPNLPLGEIFGLTSFELG